MVPDSHPEVRSCVLAAKLHGTWLGAQYGRDSDSLHLVLIAGDNRRTAL